jgi:hypothetical protein
MRRPTLPGEGRRDPDVERPEWSGGPMRHLKVPPIPYSGRAKDWNRAMRGHTMP